MKLSHLLRAGALAVSLVAGLLPARADFGASGPGGTFTLCGKTSNGIQIPCHIWVDSTNTPVGTASNPLFMQIGAGSAAIGSVTVSALPALVAGTATIGSIANISGTISLPTGASTAAAQANQLAQETAIAAALGAIGDTAYAGSGSASNIAALKGIYAQITSVLAQVTSANTANGTPADTAYAGTGSASEIAALKGLYGQLGALLTANGGVADTAYAGTGSASQIAALKGLYVQLGALLTANGTTADTAYTGSGSASEVAALKGIYAQLATIVTQAAPTSVPGTSIANTTPVPGFQGVTGGVPVTVAGTVTTQAGIAMASPAYRIPAAVAGNNAQVFSAGAKRMLQAYFCNKATSDRVVKFYDKATAPVPGTDTIVASIPAPAGTCPAIDFSAGGFPFANGLAVAITLPGDSDTGSTVAAGDITGLNIQHN